MKLSDLTSAIMKDSKTPNSHQDVPEDVVLKVGEYSEKVANWLNENGMLRKQAKAHFCHAMENYSLNDSTPEKISSNMGSLMAAMQLPTSGRTVDATVKQIIGSSLVATLGKSGEEAWGDYGAKGVARTVDGERIHNVAMESFLPASILRDVVMPGQIGKESFGVDTDKALPDLRTSIVVGIMKFFNSVTGKLFTKKMLTEPMMYLNTDEVMIYKTDSTDADIPMVELNRDPETVSVDLTRIVAREANDTVGNVLTEDGYVRINSKANLMKLSLDSTKPAYTSANKTDLISDDAKLESVVVSFTNGTITEAFEFNVPLQFGRMTYMTQGLSTKRGANITFDAYIKNTTDTRAGANTVLFAGIHNDDVVVVNFVLNPTIDLKYCEYQCTGAISTKVQNATSATTAVNGATTTAYNLVTGNAILSTKPDARFSEENLRKTNIGAEVVTRTLSYNIPVGKNYFVDYAFTQNMDTDRSTAILLNLINNGIDYRSLKLIESELGMIKDRWLNPVPTGISIFQPGEGYACSNRIKPYAYTGTFDCSQRETMKELEKMADIHTAARIFLSGICCEIDAKSYIPTQLTGGQCTYRLVTDPEFLGNILGIGHMHDRLKASAPSEPATGTVNAVVMLDSGVTLEIVSVPFASMRNKVLGVLYLDANPDSTLNFAINADMGSLVAHYQSDYANGGGLRNRLFTNVRELPIVTNPTGFVLSVTNMPAQLHMS